MKENDYIVVIGGANIDIGGTPRSKLIPADSNHGDIKISFGGVGRNIAHNLAKLGIKVHLVAAVGSDALGKEMIAECESLGMDISSVLILPEETSSMYLYINDEDGDMLISIDQMDICSRITPDYINSIATVLTSAAAVVIDGNLREDTIARIIKICHPPGSTRNAKPAASSPRWIPIFCDPVSTDFMLKLRPHLGSIDVIKPNRLEAEYLTGISIQTVEDYKEAAKSILSMGAAKVFISMGDQGVLAAQHEACDNYQIVKLDSLETDVVCTTGAGDSATAAIVWTYTTLSDVEENILVLAAKAANSAAAMTIESLYTVNPELSCEALARKISELNFKQEDLT